VLTLLPFLLLTTSFVLAAVSASSREWSWRDHYDPTFTNITGQDYRSPFVACVRQPPTTPNGSAPPADAPWVDNCGSVRAPSGLCNFSEDSNVPDGETVLFCYHLAISARLLWAGCALLAAALLGVMGLTAVSAPHVLATGVVRVASSPWPWRKGWEVRRRPDGEIDYLRPSNHGVSAYAALATTLLAGLGALVMFSALLVGGLSLLVLQFPNGDWTSKALYPDGPTAFWQHGPWLAGRAMGWCAAGATLAAVSCYAVGLVWDSPRVGLLQTHNQVPHRQAADEDEGGARQPADAAEVGHGP
jgi:hypothetical protein